MTGGDWDPLNMCRRECYQRLRKLPNAYWIDPGSRDCQPKCGRAAGAGADEVAAERSLPLREGLPVAPRLLAALLLWLIRAASPPVPSLSCEDRLDAACAAGSIP